MSIEILSTPSTNRVTIGKKPWLAASLSWLLPGSGHLYAGLYRSGCALIVLVGLLHGLNVASLLSPRISLAVVLLLSMSNNLILPICASADAKRDTRRHNSASFEKERTLGKDPWLAVFLSLIVPGSGHLYLRKWIVGIPLLLLFLPLRVIATRNAYAWVGRGALGLLVSAHAYVTGRSASPTRRRLTIAIILLLLGLYCLGRYVLPLGVDRFLVSARRTTGHSMMPTVPDRSLVVVDKLAYRSHEPMLGDIVLSTVPDHPLIEAPTAIKRIVARGGETIHIRSGIVYVDGQRRELCKRIRPPRYGGPFRVMDPADLRPYLAHGVSEPYHAPQGCYFLLGDNRWDSTDSRCYGAVERKNIIGKVVKVLWPLNIPPLYDTKSE